MNNLNRRAGRLPYIAPEILLNQPYNGIAADIFSLGQILFNLVTGKKGGFNAANDNDPYYRFIIKHQFDVILETSRLSSFKCISRFQKFIYKNGIS